MTSPKEARPPVKRALKPVPPQANLTVLAHRHVHSTSPKHQAELSAVPGSQPGEQSLSGPPASNFFLLLMPNSEVIHINTNAVPQPFLDATLLRKEP